MFLNQIKNFFIQNKINKSLVNVKHLSSNDKIKTIGIIYDETILNKKNDLVKLIRNNGVKESDISILVFKDKIYKNELFDKPTFSHHDLSWSSSFSNAEVTYFIDQKFDLLINYYDIEKLPLLVATNLSKATFKVGFPEINKKLNHFIINSKMTEVKIFVEELFKYLKILNKI